MLGYHSTDPARRTRGPFAPFGRRRLLLAMAIALLARPATAQRPDVNYDESKVPAYTLPDPLVLSNGERVRDASDWRARRRPEILKLFETHVYGKAPGRPEGLSFEVTRVVPDALGGKATRKEVSVR